jgi:hypothetical protein
MAGFIQIIEMQTSRFEEVEALGNEIRNRLDDGRPSSPRRSTISADRNRPGYYLNIVEFDSHEAAMANSGRPEVNEFAARLAKLCDAPPKFYDLDVQEVWEPSRTP